MKETIFYPSEFKTLITSSRSVSVTESGLVFEPNGLCILNLNNSFINPRLYFKRLRGCDGKININNIDYLIPPTKELEVSLGNEICINKFPNHIGKCLLTKVVVMQQDIIWGDILKALGEVKGIHLQNECLTASEYSVIFNGDNVEEIETFPLNCYKREGNKIKFLYNCRIINIKLKKIINKENKFFSFDGSSRINILENIKAINKLEAKGIEEKKAIQSPFNRVIHSNNLNKLSESTRASFIDGNIMNSFGAGFYKTLAVKNTELAMDGSLVMYTNSKFSIPVSGLDANVEYMILLNCSTLDGNGKLKFTISSNYNVIFNSDLIIPNRPTELVFKFKLNSNDNIYFHFEREKYTSLGRVALGEIKISSTEQINNIKQIEFEKKSIENIKDKYKYITQRACVLDLESFESCNVDINNYSVYLNSFEGKYWYSCVKNSIPNLQYYSIGNSINKIEKSNYYNIVLTNINDYFDCDFAFIDLFKETNKSIKKDSKIYTASIKNKLYFEKFTDNVKIKSKGLPPINKDFITQNHYFYIEYDEEITKKVVEKLSNEKLFILNSKLKFNHHNIINIPYYSGYEYIFEKFITAKSFIYLNNIDDCHISDWIDLCLLNKKDFVTNNSYYIDHIDNLINLDNIDFKFNDKNMIYDFNKSSEDFKFKINGLING